MEGLAKRSQIRCVLHDESYIRGDAFTFLSIATIHKHAKDHESEYPKAANEVKANMYVDDLLTGAPEDDSALQLKEDLRSQRVDLN